MPLRCPRLVLLVSATLFAGCGPSSQPDAIWGSFGTNDGKFSKPRAAAIDKNDRLFIVDYSARIQMFDLSGKYVGPTWTTPDYRNGRPSGLGIDRDGNLIVADSHYHCFRIYSADGTELRRIGGGAGSEPGQFGYISDVVQDADGYFYVAEFGQNDRITKLDNDGKLIKTWGKAGTEPGEFQRARALALGPDGNLYVADAINNRIQVFTRDGDLVRMFGEPGTEPGQMKMPYDLAFGPDGSLYVVEHENCRVQKFTAEGKSLGCWGGPGREPGRLHNPWALVVDRKGRVHIMDTDNHRVQRIRF
jgi:DNA-binding beta-propeller fold protein YncE